MFFILSKVLWFVTAPSHALIGLTALGAILLFTRLWKWGRVLALAGSLGLAIAAFAPLDVLLIRPLEDRFPQAPAELAAPTGIIVLGGSVDEKIAAARNQVSINDSSERLTEAVALARRFPQARIVFSGGTAALFNRDHTESEVVHRLWSELGLPDERMTFEDRSRNTYENAQFTRDFVKPEPGETWLLVTSAYHMPRSVGLFRAAGFAITPYPVDYRTRGDSTDWRLQTDGSGALRLVDTAMREWVGLAAYRLSGKIADWFPGPQDQSTRGSVSR